MHSVWSPGREKFDVSTDTIGWIAPSSAFCSIQALSGLDEPPWGGDSILLSPLIQMLISSRNPLPDTPRKNLGIP